MAPFAPPTLEAHGTAKAAYEKRARAATMHHTAADILRVRKHTDAESKVGMVSSGPDDISCDLALAQRVEHLGGIAVIKHGWVPFEAVAAGNVSLDCLLELLVAE
eukprot:CAMPEP_0202067202 /NCGR_PEP_ID=MMETSP0963-20130614/54362_1 /ASSEMBLY_ACC=CAM_ASM_000494 /TAXON_ID=4773 /ORGANISM="Schizochytrium aggregatum, Strain ATCC28209" /LENGTH=104 /DNA_ID=CAMNT_0048633915 /DNA_START=242 /DNA_END=556 /DNA_ORIENTATION=+